MLVHAHAAGDDLARLARLDALTEAQSLAAEQRGGSRRMGRAFLGVHLKLGTPLAVELNAGVADQTLCGHAPVMQGAIWRQMGFSADQAQQMAAHGLCAGILGAAVRLSVIGHFDAQSILTRLRAPVERIVATPACPPDEAHGFAPQIEIASMLHETDQMRLFVN
jgi:urease accessory protein